MSLTSSLFSGISGLTTLGNSMQIIGDNIANVNTVGFKSSSYVFQDLLSQATSTTSGTSQIGRGTALGDIYSSFQQGSFESTGNTTDLGIGGAGFFILREPGDSERLFYSRAGNFRIDKDGFLINPEGFVVQGWQLDEDGDDMGSVTDIQLESFTSPPDETDNITIITNLDADSISQTGSVSNSWDSSATIPIDSNRYQYQTTVKAYDSLGSTHDITIYYDKVSGSVWEYIVTCNPSEDKRNLVDSLTNSQGILSRGEITFNDASGKIEDVTLERFDGRIGNVSATGVNDIDDCRFVINDYAGVAVDGHGFSLAYDGTTWTPTGPAAPAAYAAVSVVSGNSTQIQLNLDNDATTTQVTIYLANDASAGDQIDFDINDPTDLHVQDIPSATYTGDALANTSMSIINYDELLADDANIVLTYTQVPVLPVTTWGITGASAVDYPNIAFSGDADSVSVDFGGDGTPTGTFVSADLTFTFTTTLAADSTITFDVEGTTAWRSLSTGDMSNSGYFQFMADFLGGTTNDTSQLVEFDIGTYYDTSFVNDAMTTTQFARSSTTVFQSSNGYGSGDLNGVDVDTDGVITGIYSNGQLIELNRVALAKFLNTQELHKEGGNLYRETRDSGQAITAHPGTNGLGDISPNSLEQSNVDIANEFVKMITSQRGFQANSKIITTVDQMLSETISMKR